MKVDCQKSNDNTAGLYFGERMKSQDHFLNAHYFAKQIVKKPQQRRELVGAVIASLKAGLKG